jgi:nucleoside-diphosphate-sugar epimerase
MRYKIAITGATGFIGKPLAARLAQAHDLISVARSEGATFVGDITQKATVEQLYAYKPDVLIHLAATNEGDMQALFSSNIIGTLNLVSQAPESLKKVILISSYAVYPSSKTPHTEDDAPAPDTEYGLTKHIAEQIAIHYCRKKGITLIILRPGTVYGPGNNKGVIHAFIRQASEGRISVSRDGSQMRSMIHRDDIIDAILAVLDHENHNTIFNVAGDEQASVLELAQIISMLAGKAEITHTPANTAKPGDLMISSERLLSKGYWRPQITLKEGIGDLLR